MSKHDNIIDALGDALESEADPAARLALIERMQAIIHLSNPVKGQPVSRVRWVPVDMVEPNDYNPNSVARKEMRLLYLSILNDGYTQPVVTIWDPQKERYVIIDGFHRYFTCKNNADIRERNHGMLPIVVLDKSINDRMASTVRHNRARGKHSVDGMANMVFSMLDEGWSDEEICNQLGMEPEELLRLKHITGFSKLFQNAEYTREWETRRQIKLRVDYEREHGKGSVVTAASASPKPSPAEVVAHPVRPNSAEAAPDGADLVTVRKRTRKTSP